MPLKGNQVRQLRALAHNLSPVLHIGKNGITDATEKQAHESLEAHELIKCTAQNSSPLDAATAGTELAKRLNAELVQVIGHRFVLYRPSERKDIKHIALN